MNTAAAAAVSKALAEGLTHPGDEHREAHVVPLAMFRTTGLDEDTTKQVSAIAADTGTAIVHTLEAEFDILPKAEAAQLRAAAAHVDPNRTINVHCHCGQWLFTMTVRDFDTTNPKVNGPAIIAAMQQYQPECGRHTEGV
jgi:hypothetical protein